MIVSHPGLATLMYATQLVYLHTGTWEHNVLIRFPCYPKLLHTAISNHISEVKEVFCRNTPINSTCNVGNNTGWLISYNLTKDTPSELLQIQKRLVDLIPEMEETMKKMIEQSKRLTQAMGGAYLTACPPDIGPVAISPGNSTGNSSSPQQLNMTTESPPTTLPPLPARNRFRRDLDIKSTETNHAKLGPNVQYNIQGNLVHLEHGSASFNSDTMGVKNGSMKNYIKAVHNSTDYGGDFAPVDPDTIRIELDVPRRSIGNPSDIQTVQDRMGVVLSLPTTTQEPRTTKAPTHRRSKRSWVGDAGDALLTGLKRTFWSATVDEVQDAETLTRSAYAKAMKNQEGLQVLTNESLSFHVSVSNLTDKVKELSNLQMNATAHLDAAFSSGLQRVYDTLSSSIITEKLVRILSDRLISMQISNDRITEAHKDWVTSMTALLETNRTNRLHPTLIYVYQIMPATFDLTLVAPAETSIPTTISLWNLLLTSSTTISTRGPFCEISIRFPLVNAAYPVQVWQATNLPFFLAGQWWQLNMASNIVLERLKDGSVSVLDAVSKHECLSGIPGVCSAAIVWEAPTGNSCTRSILRGSTSTSQICPLKHVPGLTPKHVFHAHVSSNSWLVSASNLSLNVEVRCYDHALKTTKIVEATTNLLSLLKIPKNCTAHMGDKELTTFSYVSTTTWIDDESAGSNVITSPSIEQLMPSQMHLPPIRVSFGLSNITEENSRLLKDVDTLQKVMEASTSNLTLYSSQHAADSVKINDWMESVKSQPTNVVVPSKPQWVYYTLGWMSIGIWDVIIALTILKVWWGVCSGIVKPYSRPAVIGGYAMSRLDQVAAHVFREKTNTNTLGSHGGSNSSILSPIITAISSTSSPSTTHANGAVDGEHVKSYINDTVSVVYSAEMHVMLIAMIGIALICHVLYSRQVYALKKMVKLGIHYYPYNKLMSIEWSELQVVAVMTVNVRFYSSSNTTQREIGYVVCTLPGKIDDWSLLKKPTSHTVTPSKNLSRLSRYMEFIVNWDQFCFHSTMYPNIDTCNQMLKTVHLTKSNVVDQFIPDIPCMWKDIEPIMITGLYIKNERAMKVLYKYEDLV